MPDASARSGASIPVLSIVTTVYDRAGCLESCVRSVTDLNYRDHEHIIVADHPPPAVMTELERVVAKAGDPRISLYELPERTNDFGISPAAFGLRKAQGRYLGFLDDDNVFLADHFEALISCLESSPGLGFVYSACLFETAQVLADPNPSEGSIDLGQVLFRRDLFRTQLGDRLDYSGYAWDWYLIRDLLGRGVEYRFINQETFIFRLEKFRPFEAEAHLVRARKRNQDLERNVAESDRVSEQARAQLDATHRSLAEIEAQLAAARSGLAKSQYDLDETRAQLVDRQARLDEVQARLGERQAELVERQQHLDEAQKQLSAATAAREAAFRTLGDVYGSLSWRVTWPFRAGLKLLRGR